MWEGVNTFFSFFFFFVRLLSVCSPYPPLSQTVINSSPKFPLLPFPATTNTYTQRITPRPMLGTHVLVRDKLFSSTFDKFAPLVQQCVLNIYIYVFIYDKSFLSSICHFQIHKVYVLIKVVFNGVTQITFQSTRISSILYLHRNTHKRSFAVELFFKINRLRKCHCNEIGMC